MKPNIKDLEKMFDSLSSPLKIDEVITINRELHKLEKALKDNLEVIEKGQQVIGYPIYHMALEALKQFIKEILGEWIPPIFLRLCSINSKGE